MCDSLSSGIGEIVSEAIYKSTFPSALRDALLGGYKTMSESLYQDGYRAQLKLPVGSEIRKGNDTAWGVYLQRAYITATAVQVAAIPAIAIWENVYLNHKPNKGVMI